MKKRPFSVILLSGGKGLRLGKSIPKQYLLLKGKCIAQYSFDIFNEMEEVEEIIVVADKKWRSYFTSIKKPLFFADPGIKRQDSLQNGLKMVSEKSSYVAIHDAARPFIEKKSVEKLFQFTLEKKAAAFAIPTTSTIKTIIKAPLETPNTTQVDKTMDRSLLYEIQTPQVIEKKLLLSSMDFIEKNKLDITDDLSAVEAYGEKTFLLEGDRKNIKITTKTDLLIAEAFSNE